LGAIEHPNGRASPRQLKGECKSDEARPNDDDVAARFAFHGYMSM
jgi:hypothetical protein